MKPGAVQRWWCWTHQGNLWCDGSHRSPGLWSLQCFQPLCFSSNFQSQCSGLQWFNDGVNELSQPAPLVNACFLIEKRCGSNFKRSDTHNSGRDCRCTRKCSVCEPECRYKVKIVSGTSSWYHFNHFVCLPILSFSPIHSNSFSWNVALKPAKSELFIWWSMATWETPNWDQLPEGGWWQAVCGPDLIKELEWPAYIIFTVYEEFWIPVL